MYCSIMSGALVGVQAYMVSVEVDVARGLPGFSMVGSLSGEVRESKERVQVALKNVGMNLPPTHITVNLSPADRRKEGTAFDLPIAVGMLQAFGYFGEKATEGTLFLGELGLNGEIKPVKGVLPIVREAARRGFRQCIVPSENAKEGAIIPDITVRGVSDIQKLLLFLQYSCEGKKKEMEELLPEEIVDMESAFSVQTEWEYDFAQVNGQETAKRAAEIAAAGFHNLLMVGPPGAGKSMIARRIPGILPPLTLEESLEVTSIMSVAGLLPEEGLVTTRPFRNPHHTISQAAFTGGSMTPRPGMISQAHRGVLFLDELPEFQRSVIDSMRQPLEEKQVRISRNNGSVSYPADFMLVCAMNPCPCGYYPNHSRCQCTQAQVKRYTSKVSGPILDRMDLCVELQSVDIMDISSTGQSEDSTSIRERVMVARRIQERRFAGTGIRFNADMEPQELEKYCQLGIQERKCAEDLYRSLQLSARSYHRLLRVARTIADLSEEEKIKKEHLMEAACYRPTLE